MADAPTFAYFDTRSVTGGFTEIHADPAHIVETFDTWRRAHAEHRPDDPRLLEWREGSSTAPPNDDGDEEPAR